MLILCAILAYLLGSIPFGVLITRGMGLGDLRSIGSGNIGATNVLRTGNKAAAFATLVLDGGKGAVAVLLARAFLGEQAALVAGPCGFPGASVSGLAQVPGRKGRGDIPGRDAGGKLPGGPCVLCHMARGGPCLPLFVSFGTHRRDAQPVWLALFGRADAILLALLLGALVFARHRTNINRLLKGEEPKIGKK